MLLKKAIYNKTLINLDRLVITGKYQTSVYYVRTCMILSPNDLTLILEFCF